jgi:hypothetical protein
MLVSLTESTQGTVKLEQLSRLEMIVVIMTMMMHFAHDENAVASSFRCGWRKVLPTLPSKVKAVEGGLEPG